MKSFKANTNKIRKCMALVLTATLVLTNVFTCFAETDKLLAVEDLGNIATSSQAEKENHTLETATGSELSTTASDVQSSSDSVDQSTSSEGIYRTQEEIAATVEKLLATGDYAEGEAIIVTYKDADLDDIIGSIEIIQEASSEVANILLQDIVTETDDEIAKSNDMATSDATASDAVISDSVIVDEDARYTIPADGMIENDVTTDVEIEDNLNEWDEYLSEDFEEGDIYGGYTQEEYEAFIADLEEDKEAISNIEDPIIDAQIGYVSRKDKTTRELLTKLLNNPKVISAEPNYYYEADDVEDEPAEEDYHDTEEDCPNVEEDVTEGISATTALINAGTTGVDPDMTQYQWAYNHRGSQERLFSMKYHRWETLGEDMDIPGWNENSKDNATGYVAVMDTGVDVTHPDLKGVMADLSAYTGIDGIGGGKYGKNVGTLTKPADDLTDYSSHGTHVAGIMAAEWNGEGISGSANGVKIIGVKAADETQMFSTRAVLEGITYLINLQKAITANGAPGIRAVNCSFGGAGAMSAAETLAYYNLGRTGVVAVCSAGNLYSNVDKSVHTGAKYNANPYVLTVGAIDIRGRKANFSNYGYIVDVFAPGVDILSTVPVSSAKRQYLPEFDTTRCAYDAFKTTDATYQSNAYKGTKATTGSLSKGTKVGTIREDKGYDYEGGCLEIQVSDLKENNGSPQVYLTVPIEKNATPKYIGFKEYDNLTYANYIPVLRVGMRKKDGSNTSIYWSQDFKLEGCTSIDLDGIRVSGKSAKETGFELATNNGNMYLTIVFKKGKSPSQNAYLRIDSIGAGNNAVPYGYKQGTSMAAPAAAGAVAILYSELYDNAIKSKDAKTMTAEDHAALAKSAVDYIKHRVVIPPAGKETGSRFNENAAIWRFCSSGGMVNLAANNEGVPVLKSASITEEGSGAGKQYKLTLTGEYLNCWNAESLDTYIGIYNAINNTVYDLSILIWESDKIVVDVTKELSIAGKADTKDTCIYPGVNYFQLKYGKNNKPKFESITGLRLDYNAYSHDLFETDYDIPYPENWVNGTFVDDSGQEELWTTTHTARAMASCNGEAYILTTSRNNMKSNIRGYVNFFKTDSATGKVIRMSDKAGYPGKAINRCFTSVSMAAEGNTIYAYGVMSNYEGSGYYCVCSFDVNAPDQGWKIIESEKSLPKGASIAVLNGKIYLVGSYTVTKNKGIKVNTYPVNNVYVLTPPASGNKWKLTVDGSIPFNNSSKVGFQNPKVTVGGGHIYVSRGEYRSGYNKNGNFKTYYDPFVYEYTPGNGSLKGTRRSINLTDDAIFNNTDKLNFGMAYGAGKLWLVGCSGTKGEEYLAEYDTYSVDFTSRDLKALGKNAAASYVPNCIAAASSGGTGFRLFALGDTYYETSDASKSEPAVAQVFLRSTVLAPVTAGVAPSNLKTLKPSVMINMGNGQDEPDDEHAILVNYDLGGGMCNDEIGPLGMYYEQGAELGELPHPTAAQGSSATFEGWYTECGEIVEETEEGIITYDDWGNEVTSDTTVDGEEIYDGITLYAKWSEKFNYYTVAYYAEKEGAYAYCFDKDDEFIYDDDDWMYGEDEEDDEEEFDDEDFELITMVTVAGTPGQETDIHPYDYRKGFYCTFDPDEDQEVIAADNSTLVDVVFMRESYLVIYEVANGNVDEDVAYEYVEFEDTVLEPDDIFHKYEYVCVGWYTDKACTQKYDINAPVEKDLYLYGKWVYTGHHTEPENDGKSSSRAVWYDDPYPSYVLTTGKWTVTDGKWQFTGAKGWNAIADKTWKKGAKEGDYSWFIFDEKGNMLTGWYTDADGRKYFLNPKEGTGLGAMLTGWVKIGDVYCYFCTRSDSTHKIGELIKTQKETPVVPGTILAF